ncbi:DUF2158 domain-containing protein [Trinickia mobilis]|uniref:DUF2158 domain-containing protein n=1 Tax=Trinickia mobilis TaxID=2816356 RepID=UPI001A8E3D1F
MEAKFRIGDVVGLMSGSANMTVADVIETDVGYVYHCQWVDARGLAQQQTYREAMLVPCN